MARHKRILSNSGYMHIIARGIGKQIIFEDDRDYTFYVKTLRKCSEECGVTVIAYCLMNNHIHLLIQDLNQATPKFMQRIGITYTTYYNKNHLRSGYLFEDRYLNENVEDERYLLSVFRYILNNPIKAGIALASEYKWNSYYCYGRVDTWVDTSIVAGLIGGWENYVAFIDKENGDECMEYVKNIHNDEWAIGRLKELLNIQSASEIAQYDKYHRNKAIKILREGGISVRQIERITGVSRGVIQDIK